MWVLTHWVHHIENKGSVGFIAHNRHRCYSTISNKFIFLEILENTTLLLKFSFFTKFDTIPHILPIYQLFTNIFFEFRIPENMNKTILRHCISHFLRILHGYNEVSCTHKFALLIPYRLVQLGNHIFPFKDQWGFSPRKDVIWIVLEYYFGHLHYL